GDMSGGSPYVLPGERNSAKPFGSFPRHWEKIFAGTESADITAHVSRHSFASSANDLGFTEITIAALLGHATGSITSRYVHTLDAALVMAADTVDNERKVSSSFGSIFTFMAVEVVGGSLSGSSASSADAGHMMTDAAASALAYAAFRFGQRAADSKRTFGYSRFEVIAGFVNAVTSFAIVGWIVYEAWQRFQEPQPILAGPMFGVAIAGSSVNILVFWISTRGDSEHVNIKGAALHVMGDSLGSVGAVGAAIVIYSTGWTPIDPLSSVVVSSSVSRSAWKSAGKSSHISLEGAPDGAAPEKIERHISEHVPGVAAVGHIHVWSITSGRTSATMHVRPANDTEARVVVRAVEREL
ncbi:hypothetical protein OY671_007605, partial [Metschnikowia pulcherrima]